MPCVACHATRMRGHQFAILPGRSMGHVRIQSRIAFRAHAIALLRRRRPASVRSPRPMPSTSGSRAGCASAARTCWRATAATHAGCTRSGRRSVFAGSRAKARALFAERHPGLVDRIDFGLHRRIPRGRAPGVAAWLFDGLARATEQTQNFRSTLSANRGMFPLRSCRRSSVRRAGTALAPTPRCPARPRHAHLSHHLRHRRPEPPQHRQRHHAAG